MKAISDIELAKGIKRLIQKIYKWRPKATSSTINYYIEEYYPYCSREQIDRALSMVNLDDRSRSKVRTLFKNGPKT